MQGRAQTGFELLTALAEEGDNLERRRRTALLSVLIRRSCDVFTLLTRGLSATDAGQQLSLSGKHALAFAEISALLSCKCVDARYARP